MKEVYTMLQIREHWQQYKTSHCWVVTKAGGKKVVRTVAPDMNDRSTKCVMKPLKDAIEFPKYLELISE